MSKRSPKNRRLTNEESALWQEVMRRTIPMSQQTARVSRLPSGPAEKPGQHTLPAEVRLKPFRLGQKATGNTPHFLLSCQEGASTVTSPNMDKRNFDRLKKGKLRVDGRIDLHGMTQAEAHPALIGFIRHSHMAGKRLVLVITGKGKPAKDQGVAPVRYGILKHSVPQWLRQPGVAPMVLQLVEAHAKHGGAGAYYVYLRRQR